MPIGQWAVRNRRAGPRPFKPPSNPLQSRPPSRFVQPDPALSSLTKASRTDYLPTHGDIDTAIRLCRDALSAIGDRQDVDTRVPLLVRYGGSLAEKGLFRQSLAVLDEARSLLLPDQPYRFYGLAGLGEVGVNGQLTRCLAELGQANEAITAGERALHTAEASGHIFSQLYAQSHLGWTFLILGRPDRSVSLLEDALALCELVRSNLFHPFVSAALGYALVLSGSKGKGRKLLDESRATYMRNDRALWAQQAAIWNAEALLFEGHAEHAMKEADRALQLARSAGRQCYEARAAIVLAHACLQATQDRTRASTLITEAETLARDLSMTAVAYRCSALRDTATVKPLALAFG